MVLKIGNVFTDKADISITAMEKESQTFAKATFSQKK